jgi:hypothetical protein
LSLKTDFVFIIRCAINDEPEESILPRSLKDASLDMQKELLKDLSLKR